MYIILTLGIFKHKKIMHESKQGKNSSIEWPDYVVKLDEKNFREFIKKYPLSVVDFWAPWCSPCKAMAPRVRRLSNIYKGKVAFGKIDTQENENIAKKYKVTGIPHLAFFRYGEKISGVVGLRSVGEIKDIIEDILRV